VINRKPDKRVLIVCEGQETERRYFNRLVQMLELASVDVDVIDECGSAPISVVEFAEEKAILEGGPQQGGYDFIYCVFDRDEHESFDRAIARVSQISKLKKFSETKISAAFSVPCFEYWILLHFIYERSPFSRTAKRTVGEVVVDRLKKIDGFHDYGKAITEFHLDKIIEKTDTAIKNAEKALKEVDDTGSHNPSTWVGKVILDLRALKKSSDEEAKKSR
jgi:hypothetical protein